MKRRTFVDTNVMIDLLSQRQPFYETAQKVFSLADTGECVLVVASMSFATASYVLGRKVKREQLATILRKFSALVEIASVDETAVRESLSDDCGFDDIEDAMQHYAAVAANCDDIITRNVKDFKNSSLPVYSPDAYIREYELTDFVDIVIE